MTRRKRTIDGSGIAWKPSRKHRWENAHRGPLLAWRRMRAFATWCTGHRKTVIVGWIVALIGTGMIASSAGSDFSEEFKLPASDSKEAFDLLEERFPQQSGDTIQIVYKADAGVSSPVVRKTMEGVFADAEATP